MSSFYFGSSTIKKNDKKETNTKVSVSIIGDAFADLFCYLNDGGQSQSQSDDGNLLKLGGDVRVNQPGEIVIEYSYVLVYWYILSLCHFFIYTFIRVLAIDTFYTKNIQCDI